MRVTIRMTLHAIIKIRNTMIYVRVTNFILIMAGIARILGKFARVAGMAGVITLAVIYRESMRPIELGRSPGIGCMTVTTCGAK